MRRSLRRGWERLATTALVTTLLVTLVPLTVLPGFAQGEAAEADATVRLIHASPGAPNVDVLVDGQPVVEGVAYGMATEYVPITAEEHRIQIVPTGQTADAAVVDETVEAGPGQAYLVAVFGLLNDIGGAVYDIDLSEIEPGTARVRMLNLSPDAGDLDLLETGGDEWFGDVALGEASDYRDVAPGAYSADLRGDDDRVLLTVADLTFEETQVYDVVALGQVADDTLEVQSLITSVSPPCAEVLGIEGAGGDACLRFVHAAPDTPPVDIYLSDAQLAQNLEYGTATEYVAAPSGTARQMRVTATGAPLEEAIVDWPFDLQAGQAYELLVTGAGEELELNITGTDLRPLAEDQARLRVFHASPDAGEIDLGVEGQEENLFAGVDFRDATDYLVLDAGEYALEVRPGGEDLTVALQADVTLDEGVTYDMVVIGRPDDQSLALLVLEAPVAIQTGDVATPEVVEEEGAVAATVVPEAIEDGDAPATPGA